LRRFQDALELDAATAKIDGQANLLAVGFQIIDDLGQVDIFQLNDGLDLDHDLGFDKNVHTAGANFNTFVAYLHFMFALNFKPK
jgi:hypothetical protein